MFVAVLLLVCRQAARDGLAALHGDPKRAALGEEKFELAKQEASSDTQARKKESWQKSVLDSLVSYLKVSDHRSIITIAVEQMQRCLLTKHTYLAVQVCTILSQNTTDVNSARAFAKLKEKFPDWEMVRTANNGAPLLLHATACNSTGPFQIYTADVNISGV